MDTLWRVEEVCLNVRPSPVETYCEGWLIRSAGGPVRRINALCPTPYRSHHGFASILDIGEDIYRRLSRPAVVKVLSIADGVDDLLDERGYAKEGESHVLFAERPGIHKSTSSVALRIGEPGAAWIDAWSKTGGLSSPEAIDVFRRSMDAIVLPKAYTAYTVSGEIVSLAYGVIHRGLLGVDAVATMPDHRGRGYARQVVSSLQEWASRQGVSSACLPVLADNAAAHALYRRCGFNRHLYSYHYRVR